jgi:hypothetical protein
MAMCGGDRRFAVPRPVYVSLPSVGVIGMMLFGCIIAVRVRCGARRSLSLADRTSAVAETARGQTTPGYGGQVTGDQALTALADALAKAAGDPTALFSTDLDALADRVAKTCPDIEHHLPARLAIGQLHLLRFLVLTRRPGAAVEAMPTEARRADEWLRPVAEKDAIPEPVRPAFDLLWRALDQRQPDATALRARITVDRRKVANSGDRVVHLASLGIDLRMLFDQTGDLADLREAATIGRELVAATPPEHPDFELHLSVLGVPLGMLADKIGDLSSLRDAVEFARYCCAAIPDKQSVYGGELSNFGLALRNLYERTGDEAALLLALTAGRASVAAIPPGNPVHAKVLVPRPRRLAR